MNRKSVKDLSFLDRYNPSETSLKPAERAKGKPALVDGMTLDGESVIIREWTRPRNVDDNDLVDIWKNELRLLHRLAGYPGAEGTIARLVDAGHDARGFYIVVFAGQKRPLEKFLESEKRSASWLRAASSPLHRKILWLNLARISTGLEILHSQGLIHSNLDTWSILTAGGTDPDFELTGFEWSMRIASSATEVKQKGKQGSPTERSYSFVSDWRDFGLLAAKLLKIKPERLDDLRIAPHDVAENLIASEVSLLRNLISPPALSQIDGTFVRREIEKITSALEEVGAASEAKFQLIVGLGSNNAVSDAIREASDLSIETDDILGQIAFISNDLSEEPRLLVVGNTENTSLVLRGRQLVYRLAQYVLPEAVSATWEFAKCEKAYLAEEWSGKVASSRIVTRSAIEIMTFAEAGRNARRRRGLVPFWDSLVNEVSKEVSPRARREGRFYRALSTLHALELVIASTEIFPVSVQRAVGTVAGLDGESLLEISVRADDERDALASSLGIRNFKQRLRELLEGETFSQDEGWLLAEIKGMGRRSASDIEIHFDDVIERAGEPIFRFRVASSRPVTVQEGLLVPGDFRGQLAQFERRSAAMRGLREHTELLRMLSDPRSRLIATHEEVNKDDAFLDLDEAKQKALEEITEILPLYLVQGPPGVGKSFLVNEIVQRNIGEKASSRLLLTAQSHHTVDHLMSEITKHWPRTLPKPLIVRCRARDDTGTVSPYHVEKQTKELIRHFADSPMAKLCSQALQERIAELDDSSNGNGTKKTQSFDHRSLAGLVTRSANIVFSTTNSRDLERLFEEKGQFDWTIIEEGAKATGGELLMPLLLSHRRLLIGDHKQLPPFGAEQIERLLDNPMEVKTTLQAGLENIDRSLKQFISDDLIELLEKEDGDYELAQLCTDARRALFFFQTVIGDEIARQQKPGATARRIGRILNIQHRMHPKLSNIVSRCFYDGQIKNSPKAVSKFSTGSVLSEGTRAVFPATAMTVVDMQYQQSTVGKKHIERLPRYTNDDEVRAVIQIVRELEPKPGLEGKPSLAIISPYARQVKAIKEALALDAQCQDRLSMFEPVARGGEWCSTVDAFQGNEADIIIASLVRNNHHATVQKSLGFVALPHRMNVLLSRAKWHLFLVTSLEFLKAVTHPVGTTDPNTAFLRTLLSVIAEYERDQKGTIKNYVKLKGSAQ
ncbi:hypothetical protein EGJ57_11785 [Brucella anthropi]|uniref:DEAD/DEAH box helicase n=1 Tax=Brucella anthropi TaxID=529 RepID=UPI000F68F8CD|nr:AAA domain-containing protein [Brucella anthropi]RRY19347.1 hypothetical protein EGJ57_11785 [Brucella anthropi]